MAGGLELAYIAAAVAFILGLKLLGRAETARRGNALSAFGMLVAVVATLLAGGIDPLWVAVGLAVGALIGAVAARLVKMTAMPEMVALFNGSGGLASMGVAAAEWIQRPEQGIGTAAAIAAALVVGAIAASGSVVAWGKLSETLPGRPVRVPAQQVVISAVAIATLAGAAWFVVAPDGGAAGVVILATAVLAWVVGVLLVLPIGGADMPIVVSLLNAYSGLAASMAGFVLGNSALVVAGSLVGASGFILTNIMSKAMNRSLTNVLFGGFGGAPVASGTEIEGEVKPITAEDAYYILEAASNVIVVPGYGMAVAQAQHVVRELAELLEKNGAEVRYAIHPVAGRMPGHMNVLLAEANVPYERLVEPGDVNPTMDTVDVAIVIGANDVVNPAAREDASSPLYGMPIINVDEARTTFVLKRSMNPGFSGVQNPLFFKPNTRMLFGDGKAMVGELVSEFKETLGE
ncbi:MAG: NAD(P)(+) transhydrogenase (Re/Si-specific) subunit beta [Trueperaceae bacterium]|nr:NAD(P)(+) transhydrogenase (Re/Si-specific) subunit beta [Trueperaceae bacterium]